MLIIGLALVIVGLLILLIILGSYVGAWAAWALFGFLLVGLGFLLMSEG